MDMLEVYDCLPKDELKRIEGIEFLDEVEEWKLLLGHYCISWAHRGEQRGLAEIDLKALS